MLFRDILYILVEFMMSKNEVKSINYSKLEKELSL